MQQPGKKNLYIGVSLAVMATIIWSVNFVIARGISSKVPPLSLNFFRWASASALIFPFAFKSFLAEKELVFKHWKYFFAVSFSCILLFNSMVYIAGHHTTAINLALVGTTSSPIFTIILSAIFLKEAIRPLRILGLLICITGILYLLSQGSFQHLLAFRFSRGDWWILSGAFFFALYTILVKRRPEGISSLVFLFVFILLGAGMLLPLYIWEYQHAAPIAWNGQLRGVILYLGLGTSIIAYLCWNAAILRIGSSRTGLFGNLMPLFSAFEALLVLNEKIQTVHIISGILVITGLIIANLRNASMA
ncbi:MAG: DMT family transporter [Chitinophagaceae bacterium]